MKAGSAFTVACAGTVDGLIGVEVASSTGTRCWRRRLRCGEELLRTQFRKPRSTRPAK